MHKFRNWFGGSEPRRPIGTERDLELKEAIGLGVLPELVPDMGALLRGADRIAPVLKDCAKPKTATELLQANLERTVLTNNARERVLRQEIADREAELTDVLRAASAASTALVELVGPPGTKEAFDRVSDLVTADFANVEAAYLGTLTDEDLEAALGRAIELDRDNG